MAAGGAAVVIEDAELEPERLRALAAELLARPSAARGDGLGRRRARAPRRRRAGRGRAAGRDRQPCVAMSNPDWSGRELHFIAIGGAGMSGLALVCARARGPGDRLRSRRELVPVAAAGGRARAAGRPRRRAGARGRRGRRLDRDRRRQPGAGPGARARSAGHPSRRAARRALLAAAADRGLGHPRQDDHRGDAGARAAGDGRRPRVPDRRRAARRRPRGRAGERRLGGGGVGGRRGRRVRRQLPRARGPRSRWSPTSSSTTTRAGARGRSCWRRSAASPAPPPRSRR